MSKLNINKNEWLELVFEGKNKEYGAYQLRQEDGKTTMKAFFSAIALISGIALLPVLLSSFADKPVAKPLAPDPFLHVTEIVFKHEEIKKVLPASKKETQKPIKSKDLANTRIVEATKAPDIDFTKPEDVGKTNTTNTASTGTENNPETGNTHVVITEPVDNPNEIKPSGILDKSPNFPGGINEFLKTVGKKFVTPELEEEKTIKILVFFVVERDGTLSNITVPKNPGFGLDLEAIRVLKSIKTKWDPGIYKGKPVRTSYSLPILIKTQ
ncbi:protein TonB [Flavobacterium swingsii]|uniref:Protein TonB n=1 Tax=Flavobacterium swingsii TaxID=498292 RepID=A0A1I0VBY0_9FLAO|nr:energy transducer TonB [Flavobacterium swingsii]SFA73762.1 protein TonB [Flavobacterium swingsii]